MNRNTFSKRSTIGRRKQRGQGMTEYIIIVALVAIGAIGVYSAFGHTVQYQMSAITNGLAGNSSGANTAVTSAGTEATTASTDASNQLGLNSYTQKDTDQ